MYLMNVPPVAVTQTEWRACGAHGSYSSLPACFNDSDTELSTRGTPISDKVQMIIESLRSTQSSLEMGDEIEGAGLSGRDAHADVCKVAVGSYVGARPKARNPASSPNARESSDSDSDDSVDRGIEEAILEYLKEKDDHKRKGDPCPAFLQSKIPRKSPSIPEASAQTPEGTAFSINHFPKSVKPEVPTGPAAIPIKKYIKNKASLHENAFQGFDPSKSATKNMFCLKEQALGAPKPITSSHRAVQCPARIKAEDLNDSSSDDGIEEAIQRYQLEKQTQQTKRDPFVPQASDDESDSTSDDGIEEAIRCYQLEQLKERSVLKPFLHKEKPFGKAFMHSVGGTSAENPKKLKLRKKRARTEKEGKPPQPLSSVFIPKSLSDCPKGKGNGLNLFKLDSLKEPTAPAPPKVTTNAELLCAEAILDISKTVMPEPFRHPVGLGCAAAESSFQSPAPDLCPDEESDESSVDSEDGIEQEIRKFLEQKAQSKKQPSGSSPTNQEPQSVKVRAKDVAGVKKTTRLSLTHRRKSKEKSASFSEKPLAVHEPVGRPLAEPTKEANPPTSRTQPVAEQSGDKSSSLDSDEDLDTAIKDLLKTKKRSKKKIRDLKRKSKKCLRDEESLSGNASQAKKIKPEPLSKKTLKSKDEARDKFGPCRRNEPQQREVKEVGLHEDEPETSRGPRTPSAVREDSSSVDSDDSIELEIRRFLAEKAKVSTPDKSQDAEVSRNGAVAGRFPLPAGDVKQEPQLAEIPRTSVSSPPSGQCPRGGPAQTRAPLLAPQSSPQVISAVVGQSRVHSVLEPADGAGPARAEQRKPPAVGLDGVGQTERARPASVPGPAHSRSEAIKWRQSLGLPVPAMRPPSRTPFQISSSESGKAASAPAPQLPPPYLGTGHNSHASDGVWSCARTSKAPFSCAAETSESPAYRSSVLNLFSAARQHPRATSFAQSLTPGLRPQCSSEGERERTVHISKDKSVYVELETNRTNHVQVQSRERTEGKQRTDAPSDRKREGESVKIEQKDVQLEIKEEEFIDEPECESVGRRNPEQTQGFSTLCLTSAIDPGISISPCIAFTSEDRSRMLDRRYLDVTYKKGKATVTKAPVPKRTLQCVKKKLQFVSAGQRRNPASTA